jgi:hypothetical protein
MKMLTVIFVLFQCFTVVMAITNGTTSSMPPLAGLCTGNAGVGVGCGFDASRTTMFGLTVAPKKAVLRLPWCQEHCYTTCPPQQPIPYECEDCVFFDTTAPGGGACYRQPYNLAATPAPIQGGCFESRVFDSTKSYDEEFSKTTSHSSGFIFTHTSSKTVKKFYQMFFEKNYSMSLYYKYIITHSVTLVPSSMYPEPSRELQAAALLLPAKYEGSEAHYRRFIDTFGTHFVDEAYMGASAIMTNYFHSCFLHTFSMKEVTEASHSSFLGIFNENNAHGWGSAIDKQMWDSYSDIQVKLNGGDAAEYGVLNLNNTLNQAAVAAWQASINQSNVVPLTYSLRPITDVMKGGWLDDAIVNNVHSALVAYDAEVGEEMKKLQDSLVAKDNYTTPKWCKAPKPPSPPDGKRRRRSSSSSSSVEQTSDLQETGLPLPGCPELPPTPPLPRRLSSSNNDTSSTTRAMHSASNTADPLVPGLLAAAGDTGSLFARGYDPLEQESRSLVAEWHFNGWTSKGQKDPNLSNKSANTWIDLGTGRSWGLPDEIQIFNTPAADSGGEQHIFVNSSAYKKWHWSQSSSSINLGIFSYSHSQMSSFIEEIMDTNRSVIAVNRRLDVAYQMTLWNTELMKCEMQPICSASKEPGTQRNSSFAMQRAALPTTCPVSSSNAGQYGLFRQTFGTHYVESAIFGGELQFVLVMNSELFTKMTFSEMMEQTTIGFNILFLSFSFYHKKIEEAKDVSQTFRENTRVVLMAYGGNSLLLEEGDYNKWAASVPLNPAPIDVTFRNITDLFDEGTPQRACMEAEVQSYLETKPMPRYRCGDAAGTQIRNGLPRPSGFPKPHIIHRPLPTLDEIRRRRAEAQQERAPTPVPEPRLSALSRPPPAAGVPGIPCNPNTTIPGASTAGLIGKTFDTKKGIPKLRATPLTCSQGKTWLSPTMGLVQIPDQLDFVDVNSACHEENMNNVANSTSAWKYIAEEWGFQISLNIPLGPACIKIGIGFEKQMKEITSKLANYTKSWSTLRRRMGLYRLSFGTSGSSPLAKNSELQLALANLPAIKGGYSKGTAEQRNKYDMFINAFGTHYVAAADFGAHCAFSTSVNTSFTSKYHYKYVEEQISISIGIQMKGIGISFDMGYGMVQESMKQDEEFKREAETQTSCSGGDTTLLDQEPPQYDKWVQSVYQAPSWVNGSTVLKPLTELIVGDNDAAIKRSCLQEAIMHYMAEKPPTETE